MTHNLHAHSELNIQERTHTPEEEEEPIEDQGLEEQEENKMQKEENKVDDCGEEEEDNIEQSKEKEEDEEKVVFHVSDVPKVSGKCGCSGFVLCVFVYA